MVFVTLHSAKSVNNIIDAINDNQQKPNEEQKNEVEETPQASDNDSISPSKSKSSETSPEIQDEEKPQQDQTELLQSETDPSVLKQNDSESDETTDCKPSTSRDSLKLDLPDSRPVSPPNDPVISPLTRELTKKLARGDPVFNENYDDMVTTVFKENRSKVLRMGTRYSPLEILPVVMPDYSFHGINGGNGSTSSTPGKHQIMLLLRIPPIADDISTPYKPNHFDYDFSERLCYVLDRAMAKIGIRQRLRRVRFFTNVQLFMRPGVTPIVSLVLTENCILWVTTSDGVDVIKTEDPAKIKILCMVRLGQDPLELGIDSSDNRTIQMRIGDSRLRLIMSCVSDEVAHVFVDMVKYKHLNVPLDPDDFHRYCTRVGMELMPRVRSQHISLVDVVSRRILHSILCVPVSVFESAVGNLTIWERLCDMEVNEELCLIVYSSRGIHFVSGFMGADLENWRYITTKSFMEDRKNVNMFSKVNNGDFTIDMVIKVCNDLLSQDITANSLAQILIISDENIPLRRDVPKVLLERGVDIFTIGLGGNHNIESLNRISECLAGHYTYIENIHGLSTTLKRYKQFTCKGYARNLKVQLKLRLHTEIVGVTYDDTFYKPLTDKFTHEGSKLTWDIGKMYANETNTLFVHFTGKVPPGEPIMRLKISYEDMFAEYIEPIERRFEVDAPIVKLNQVMRLANKESSKMMTLVQAEYQISIAYKRMMKLLNIMLYNKNRVSVFNVRNYLNHLEKLDLGPDFDAFIAALNSACRAQLDHSLKDRFIRRDKVCELVRDLWALKSRRSLTAVDDFGIFFMRNKPQKLLEA